MSLLRRWHTDRLIPLFAVGAFLTFALSQAGMVVHWRRALKDGKAGSGSQHKLHLRINSAGAVATCVALTVIVVAKFEEGAWITVAVIPCVIVLLKLIRGYYDEVDARIRTRIPLDLRGIVPPIVVVVIEDWNKLADKALAFALCVSPDVIGVHLTQLEGPESDEHHQALEAQWRSDVQQPADQAGLPPPRLVTMQAQYRAIHEPVLKLVKELQKETPGRRVAVLIPELVKQRWYQHLLHTHRARHLRAQLLRQGGSQLTVINVPWYLDGDPAQALSPLRSPELEFARD